MKRFVALIFSFFLLEISFAFCGKSNSTSRFHFNDVPSLLGSDTSSTIMYPLLDNLAQTDDFVPHFVHTYDELSYPNPFVQPEECVLSLGISHSWLCDPQQYLTIDDQLEVEAALLKIRDTNFHKCSNHKNYYYQIGVAIVPQIVVRKNETVEESARRFAHQLLNKWGIGNKNCHDGILIVYIKEIGKFLIAKREGVEEKYINEKEIKNKFINTYFATGSLSKALIESIEFIHTKLPSQPQELTDTAKIFLLLIFLYIISITILYFSTSTYNKCL